MKPTAPTLIRWTGTAAKAAEVILAGIQPIHPPDELSSVTTSTWATITTLKLAMYFLLLNDLGREQVVSDVQSSINAHLPT